MMPLHERKAVAIYLNPSEIVIAEGPAKVTTVLGSCVSVTFFSPKTRLAAICHAVLPNGMEKEPGKFVNQSIGYMIDFFQEKKVRHDELVAKVFGGADMFPLMRGSHALGTIGAQNIQAALTTLELSEIPPAVVEVGGQQGRKLVFYTETGDVFIKRVPKEQLPAAERALLTKERQKIRSPRRS
ncbi:chemotaxis protein CheD [Desulfobulbus rhabdoformis]|jgi:chemotaxis protein CheD|uniref:chemotaxis protein CheD n=1 Tax=Desulfobulbus rhabdoformis TaxID=34032 RepID=UPI001964F007|nr:chemotaxis protein CheD [Desulfobulbus rhabdoformis]MBM9614928.1 chemotaxis protein CheD [Desulfobulbus rhabdoformis]